MPQANLVRNFAVIKEMQAKLDRRPTSYGTERLRETSQRLRSLAMGATGETARTSIALIGDSWTRLGDRYARKVAQGLWDKYQGAAVAPIGPGFTSFARIDIGANPHGHVLDDYAIEQVTGTWATSQGSGPDLSKVTGQTGAELRTADPIDYTVALSRYLFAMGGAGLIEYSWDAGSTWTEIDLSALSTGFHSIELTGAPGTGSSRFHIRVTTGPTVLFGINQIADGTEGVIVHKLGYAGTSSYSWVHQVNIDEDVWIDGLSALEPDLAIPMLGTNDQAWMSLEIYKNSMVELISRVQTARPTADILLVAPAENQRTNNFLPMSDYAGVLYEIAQEQDVAYLDLQPSFGVFPADYAYGSARPWFMDDLIHPEPTAGGYAIASAILRVIAEGGA